MKLAYLKENSIKEAIHVEASSISMGLVLDNKVLLGVVTQGDIVKFTYNENTLLVKSKIS